MIKRRIISIALVIALVCTNIVTGTTSAASREEKETFIIKYAGKAYC